MWGPSTAVISILLLAPIVQTNAFDCTGEYCTDGLQRPAQVECPKPCRFDQCVGRSSIAILDDLREKRPTENLSWSEFARLVAHPDFEITTWQDVASSGLYDHVHIDGDEVCLSSCWYQPWNAQCQTWKTFHGARYCADLTCKQESRNMTMDGIRYSGCFADTVSDRHSLPWHKPTCSECARLFPDACAKELMPYVDDPDVAKVEAEMREARRNRELEARQYCYLSYFEPVFRQEVADEDDNSSDKSAVTDQSRRLLSSSEDSSPKPKFVDLTLQTFRGLENRERLTCPAPQCLTYHDELLGSLMAPWYHSSDRSGYCSFNGCQTGERTGARQWCRSNAGNCISCNGTWCPAEPMMLWTSVTAENFEMIRPKYQEENSFNRFPRSACKYRPITSISRADAYDLPWFDTAGAGLSIEPRSPDSLTQSQSSRERRKIEKEKALIGAKLEAQRRALELKRQRMKTEGNGRQPVSEDARNQMHERTSLNAERRISKMRKMESAARQYCYGKYVKEAAKYGGISMPEDAMEALVSAEAPGGFQLEQMELAGELECPPAKCYFDTFVDDFAEDGKPSAAQDDLQSEQRMMTRADIPSMRRVTRDLIPWYYKTFEGFCSWRKECLSDAQIVASQDCQQGIGSCLSCGGTWCPPVKGQGFLPVTKENRITLREAFAFAGMDPVKSALIGTADAASEAAGDLFDYSSCTNSPVTFARMQEVEDLEWPGMNNSTSG